MISNTDQRVDPQRSKLMSQVRGRNTTPEIQIRKLLHSLGYRFRLHRKDLPGTPDIVFPSRRKVIFVHGCFWHRHEGCRFSSMPKTRVEFWKKKFEENIARDSRKLSQLRESGWTPLVIWQCELRDENTVRSRLVAFLES